MLDDTYPGGLNEAPPMTDEERAQEIDKLREIHQTNMRNINAANDMIDLDIKGLALELQKPKTDYERFIDERGAAQILRDDVCWVVGLTTDPTSAPQLTVEMAHDRLKAALEAHDANRDNGLGDFEGTQI